MARERAVIVGGGQAAAQIADQLAFLKYPGEVLLVSEEAHPPYQRPPLSKQYLAGGHDADWLLYRPRDFYRKRGIALKLDARVAEIERSSGVLRLESGERLAYDRLALATGSQPRRLWAAGAEAPRVLYLRSIANADLLRAALPVARRILIIGGGFIGLEVAAMLSATGRTITILQAQSRIAPRALAPLLSDFLQAEHERHGITIRTGSNVTELREFRDRLEVVTDDGTSYAADLVLVGIGVEPDVMLAKGAGLACDDGILVDDHARTSDAAIVAAGDCTNHPNGLLGRRLRLETVHNAVEQGRTAGSTIAGVSAPYSQAPWVWSDQYDLRLQIVGVHDFHDQAVIRGSPSARRFSIWFYRSDWLVAVSAINRPADFAAARRLIDSGASIDPAQAADPNFDLRLRALTPDALKFDKSWKLEVEAGASAIVWP